MRTEPVRPRGGLLAVHAHPDDETLATGALLATWAASGEPVTLVTCTRGEQGEVIGAELAHLEGDGPALAAHREGELAAALESLGVSDHVFLDQVEPDEPRSSPGEAGKRAFRDSGMAWAAPGIARAAAEADLPEGALVGVPLDEAARRLAHVLRERRPRVVVTYEPSGGYGHPDHVRAHEITVRAIEIAREEGSVVPDGGASDPEVVRVGGARAGDPSAGHDLELWQSVVPAEVARAARRELAVLPGVATLRAEHPELTLPDPDEPLPPVAKKGLEEVVVVDVRPVLGAVVGALRAHATQVQHVGVALGSGDGDPTREGGQGGAAEALGWYALSNDVLAALPSREFYTVTSESAGASRTFTGNDQTGPVAWTS
ncbi:PIG-L family deacetylase [Oerskovia enterophila]|uniref:1D-myo-inositol 2-acetamido-2-deoxy-alpha-D-glucopyranoside deacetylase n=1 Tax=Oerskovia enterophila TaxID=43678 RepID=A0A163SEK5_9CELL|nr:PIG-L family deacetylase [Oerskovia enterophila]KZM36331.1 1D-myo-inositol 2-acetamido-2-deoxy-alpha-D-glucopyranoside deacetylase [Oerskovia enterophila]